MSAVAVVVPPGAIMLSRFSFVEYFCYYFIGIHSALWMVQFMGFSMKQLKQQKQQKQQQQELETDFVVKSSYISPPLTVKL